MDNCRDEVRHSAGESIRLTLETSRPELEANGTRLRLAPREHLVFLFLASRARAGDPPLVAQKDAMESLNAFCQGLVDAAPDNDFSDWRHTESLGKDLEDVDLRKALSSLRQRLLESGPATAAVAGCLPRKGRFSLSIPGPMIFLR